MNGTLTRDVTVTVIGQPGQPGQPGPAKLAGELCYDSADPFAVRFCVQTPGQPGGTVTWLFARDLLLAGTKGPAGYGDVRLAPVAGMRVRDHYLRVDLDNGRAVAAVCLPLLSVAEFLVASYSIVPSGQESVAFDGICARLLER